MLPNHKNIINILPPNLRFFNKRIQNFVFQMIHKQNSVYGSANLLSMTVPWSCLKDLIFCSKTLFFKTHSGRRIKLSIELVWFSCLTSAFGIACSASFGLQIYSLTAHQQPQVYHFLLYFLLHYFRLCFALSEHYPVVQNNLQKGITQSASNIIIPKIQSNTSYKIQKILLKIVSS